MKYFTYITLLLAWAFTACTGGNQTNQDNNTANQDTVAESSAEPAAQSAQPEEKTIAFQPGEFTWDMAEQVDYTGDVVYGKSWQDQNGENLLVFSEKTTITEATEGPSSRSIELHAYHYADGGNGFELVREVKDFERDCGFANGARFIEPSVTITDLNNNNYAEITFMYRLGCSSEYTSNPQKLMLLENGEKYAIRGNTKAYYGPEHSMGGEMNVEPELQAAEAFYAHATDLWNQYQEENALAEQIRPVARRQYKKFMPVAFFGVEPAWKVTLQDETFTFERISMGGGDNEATVFTITEIRQIDDGGLFVGARAAGNQQGAYLEIKKETCSDGMSNNEYPYSVRISGNNMQYHGCGQIRE